LIRYLVDPTGNAHPACRAILHPIFEYLNVDARSLNLLRAWTRIDTYVCRSGRAWAPWGSVEKG
jgi:hypothetical protein